MRADEYEGSLNDSLVKRAHDRLTAKQREIEKLDLRQLVANESFLRWFGRYAMPLLMQDQPVQNGSNLAHFMGQRGLILRMLGEMEQVADPRTALTIFKIRADFLQVLKDAARGAQHEE